MPIDNFDGSKNGQYFEEFISCEFPRGLGVRIIPDAQGRALGVAGRKDYTLTKPLELMRGPKVVTIKASAKNPVKVFSMLQRIEGRKS